jgi:hypothetical protein
MKYTHLIISRVNIKWREQSKDENWLRDRIAIMNKTIRPSIEGQTNKNFKFITLWGYDPIDVIDNEYPIKIETVGLKKIYFELLEKLKDFIDEENVLVTRIDSDNCLGNDFVEVLQKNIRETDLPFYYDIPKLYFYHMITKQKRIWTFEFTSGCISIMEKSSDFKCIPYQHSHGKIGTIVNGIRVDGLDTLINIHGGNLSAHMLGQKKVDFNLDKFNLKL